MSLCVNIQFYWSLLVNSNILHVGICTHWQKSYIDSLCWWASYLQTNRTKIITIEIKSTFFFIGWFLMLTLYFPLGGIKFCIVGQHFLVHFKSKYIFSSTSFWKHLPFVFRQLAPRVGPGASRIVPRYALPVVRGD